ncbi:MAG TPA: shikimate kinase [Phycisphaerae bacterium]|nr:shikimate kinase [Phycisphaerae bacterium]
MNIVLIGYRGSGKTSVGRLLAARLGMSFIDTDDLIVAKSGKTIRKIFEAGGEQAFRDLETAVVAEVAARDHTVIAAGGGVVLRSQNVEHLRRTGRIVWLTAPPEVLFKRIQGDQQTTATRPNLTSAGGLEEIRKLLEIRRPFYQAAAHITVDVSLDDVERIAHFLSAMV